MARAKYSQQALARELSAEDLFGERLLGYAKHPVIVPAINYSTGLPVVFKTPHHPHFLSDHKQRLVDIALATSAAPMYFPRHCFNDAQYVDGGLYANAPGLMGVHEAEYFFGQARKNIHLLSIGTMSSRFTVDPRRNRSGGTLDWGGWFPAETPKRLFGVSISAQESAVDNMLKQMLEPDRYHHIDALLTDEQAGAVGLDKTGPGAREVLLGAAKNSTREFLGKAAARALLNHRASAPVFHHGPRTAEVP